MNSSESQRHVSPIEADRANNGHDRQQLWNILNVRPSPVAAVV